MSTGMKNAKSQMISTRVPHDIVEAIEGVRHDGETMPTFVITAFRNEIARRQAGGTAESSLVSALDALKRVKEIGCKTREEISTLIDAAESELQRTKTR